MKIGLVLNAPPGYSETFFNNKIRILNEAGYTVKVYADNRAESASISYKPGIRLRPGIIGRSIALAQFIGYAVRSPVRTIKLYLRNKESGKSLKTNLESLIISAHIIGDDLDWLHFGFGTLAVNRENLANVIGSKMAMSLRGYDIGNYPLKNPGIYIPIWPKVDKLHFLSNALLEKAVNEGFDPLKAKMKITPAVNTELFSQPLLDLETMFSDKSEPIEFSTVARVHWKKGLVMTLYALAKLKEKGVRFRYRIAGTGSISELERTMYAIHELGLKDQVIIMGAIGSESVRELYIETDIYIQYSVQEGFCNAVIEAQSMGLICVVSDTEGLPENVIDGETGFVVPRNNQMLLAEKLNEIIQMDPEQINALRKKAVARAQEIFTLEYQRRQFLKFYEN